MDLSTRGYRSGAFPGWNHQSIAPTAAERVLAAELKDRDAQNDALSMMVSSMARMVQAGKTRDSRWKAS